MKGKKWLMAGALTLLSSAAFADTVLPTLIDTTPTIDVGENVLLPNTTGQQVIIPVKGGMSVNSEVFDAQVDNGRGPAITAVDIIGNGAIFQGHNTGQTNNPANNANAVQANTRAPAGDSVSADGRLATLTFDTTGVQPGSYTLNLTGTQFGSTSFTTPTPPTETTVTPRVNNGHVIVVYPGDANLDGTVNFADLLILAQNYGKNGETFTGGDFNNDGNVGFDDLLLLAQNYGKTVQAVPVPTAIFGGLGLIGLIAGAKIRKSRKEMA